MALLQIEILRKSICLNIVTYILFYSKIHIPHVLNSNEVDKFVTVLIGSFTINMSDISLRPWKNLEVKG